VSPSEKQKIDSRRKPIKRDPTRKKKKKGLGCAAVKGLDESSYNQNDPNCNCDIF